MNERTMMNRERQRRAAAALALYEVENVSPTNGEAVREAIIDLLADVQHLARGRFVWIDMVELSRIATRHVHAETGCAA